MGKVAAEARPKIANFVSCGKELPSHISAESTRREIGLVTIRSNEPGSNSCVLEENYPIKYQSSMPSTTDVIHPKPKPNVFTHTDVKGVRFLQSRDVLTAKDLESVLRPLTGQPTVCRVSGSSTPWEQSIDANERMIWVLNGCSHVDDICAVLRKASPCSRVVVVLSHTHPNLVGTTDEIQMGQLYADDRLFLVQSDKPIEQAKTLNTLIDLDKFAGWRPVLPSVSDIDSVEYLRSLYRELTNYLNIKSVSKQTQVASSHLFLMNALVNAVFANPLNSIQQIKDVYKNRPALIVATGPSLNKQLPILQKYQDQFVIIAVDPAVPLLKQYGITPSFVVSVDPKKRPYWKQDQLDLETTFVLDLGCCPDVAWSNNQRYITTTSQVDVNRLLISLGCEAPLLLTGGSVATTAFNVAAWIGANPIVMIGQDLAWTQGRHHAEGYVSQYSSASLQERYDSGFDVEGYDGLPVRTEKQLLYYKTWFEHRIQHMGDTLVINATEGGAKIQGALQLPFNTVCEEISKTQLPAKPPLPLKPWAPDFKYLAHVSKELKSILQEIESLESKLNHGIKLVKGIKTTPKRSVVRQIDELNHQLTKGDWRVKTVVEMVGQAAVAATEQKIRVDGVGDTVKDVFGGYLKVYEAALWGISPSKKFLSRVCALYDRIVEAKAFDPHWLKEAGFNRWNEDGTANPNAL